MFDAEHCDAGHIGNNAHTRATLANASTRLETIFSCLVEAAACYASDADETHARADAALARLLRKDPMLRNYWAIMDLVRAEIDAIDARISIAPCGGEPRPARAANCVTPNACVTH